MARRKKSDDAENVTPESGAENGDGPESVEGSAGSNGGGGDDTPPPTSQTPEPEPQEPNQQPIEMVDVIAKVVDRVMGAKIEALRTEYQTAIANIAPPTVTLDEKTVTEIANMAAEIVFAKAEELAPPPQEAPQQRPASGPSQVIEQEDGSKVRVYAEGTPTREIVRQEIAGAVGEVFKDPGGYLARLRQGWNGTIASQLDPTKIGIKEIEQIWDANPEYAEFVAMRRMPDPLTDAMPEIAVNAFNQGSNWQRRALTEQEKINRWQRRARGGAGSESPSSSTPTSGPPTDSRQQTETAHAPVSTPSVRESVRRSGRFRSTVLGK